jgi:hypothetical protein
MGNKRITEKLCENCGHPLNLGIDEKYYHYPRWERKDLKCHNYTSGLCKCNNPRPKQEKVKYEGKCMKADISHKYQKDLERQMGKVVNQLYDSKKLEIFMNKMTPALFTDLLNHALRNGMVLTWEDDE